MLRTCRRTFIHRNPSRTALANGTCCECENSRPDWNKSSCIKQTSSSSSYRWRKRSFSDSRVASRFGDCVWLWLGSRWRQLNHCSCVTLQNEDRYVAAFLMHWGMELLMRLQWRAKNGIFSDRLVVFSMMKSLWWLTDRDGDDEFDFMVRLTFTFLFQFSPLPFLFSSFLLCSVIEGRKWFFSCTEWGFSKMNWRVMERLGSGWWRPEVTGLGCWLKKRVRRLWSWRVESDFLSSSVLLKIFVNFSGIVSVGNPVEFFFWQLLKMVRELVRKVNRVC